VHWVLELELQQTNNDYENVITIIIIVAYNKCSAVAGMGDRLATTDVAWAEIYLPTKWHRDSSTGLGTTDMSQKLGVVPLWAERTGSPSNNALAEAYLHTKWHPNPSSRLTTISMGRILGVMPLLRSGARSPSNTV